MVKKFFRNMIIIIIVLSIISYGYKMINLTDLQKTVKSMGFEHFNTGQTIYDSYRISEKNENNYCNQLIIAEVYDNYPYAITYTCEREDKNGITQYAYNYYIKTNSLEITSEDLSYPYETAADKQVYEKMYNENFKDYNEKILNELNKRTQS